MKKEYENSKQLILINYKRLSKHYDYIKQEFDLLKYDLKISNHVDI